MDELRSRGVGFRVLAGAETDTTTANERLVFGILASLAEFERELIAERTRAGLAASQKLRKRIEEGFGCPSCSPRRRPDARET